MSEFLPKEVREGLAVARRAALEKKSRLRVHAGDSVYPVLKMHDNGFSLDKERAPSLRGLVDLYDGARHLYQCLIIASWEEDDRMTYEFKRNTAVATRAPLDYVRGDDAPVALLQRN